MKFIMMIAVFGAMTALFALIGLSDAPHASYQSSEAASFQ